MAGRKDQKSDGLWAWPEWDAAIKQMCDDQNRAMQDVLFKNFDAAIAKLAPSFDGTSK